MTPKDPVLIGRAEYVAFPEIGYDEVPARIDTGAKTSAIWVSSATPVDGTLHVVFFGEGSPLYTGKPVVFDVFDQLVVASSTGVAQQRYRVSILVTLAGRRIRASFTLADRSSQAYPVLIGRNVLHGKFIVDVKLGTPMRDAESRRAAELRSYAENTGNEENV